MLALADIDDHASTRGLPAESIEADLDREFGAVLAQPKARPAPMRRVSGFSAPAAGEFVPMANMLAHAARHQHIHRLADQFFRA